MEEGAWKDIRPSMSFHFFFLFFNNKNANSYRFLMSKREKRKFDISAVGYKKIKSSNLSKKKRKEKKVRKGVVDLRLLAGVGLLG